MSHATAEGRSVDASASMMLYHAHFVRVAFGQKRLKILFDIVSNTKSRAQTDHAFRVLFPVDAFGERAVVYAPDFVEVDEFVGALNNGQTAFRVEGWFQRYPGKHAATMEGFQRLYAILRQSRMGLPFSRKSVFQAGQRGSKCIAISPVQIDVPEGSGPALCENAECQSVFPQDFDR